TCRPTRTTAGHAGTSATGRNHASPACASDRTSLLRSSILDLRAYGPSIVMLGLGLALFGCGRVGYGLAEGLGPNGEPDGVTSRTGGSQTADAATASSGATGIGGANGASGATSAGGSAG